jgi:AraC family transcriptional regulator
VRHHIGRWVGLTLHPLLSRVPRPEADCAGITEFGFEAPCQDDLIQAALHAIAREVASGRLDRMMVDVLVNMLIVQLARHSTGVRPVVAAASALPRAQILRVLDYIETNLGEDLSLSHLAGVACLSPPHFSRSFKAAIGMGLHRYVTRRRIERAKLLLRQGGPSLALIAATLGFYDQAHFTNTFRREMGMTPGDFRAATA